MRPKVHHVYKHITWVIGGAKMHSPLLNFGYYVYQIYLARYNFLAMNDYQTSLDNLSELKIYTNI